MGDMVCPRVLFVFLAALVSASASSGMAGSTKVTHSITRILVLGDSLTEGYGVAKEEAFPALLEQELRRTGHAEVQVINGGIGGSTSASGVSRLKWHLRARPELIVIALGANDGLRGLSLGETRRNLAAVIELARRQELKILLAAMKLPPNYGKEYSRGFHRIYEDLARDHLLPWVPFLLEGVGGEPSMNLEDGIHPNEKGHRKIAATLKKHLEPLL